MVENTGALGVQDFNAMYKSMFLLFELFSLVVQFDQINGLFCDPIFVQKSQKTNCI